MISVQIIKNEKHWKIIRLTVLFILKSRDNGSPIEQIIPLLQFLERVMGNKDKDFTLKDDDL